MIEEWKDVPSLEALYEVSNTGVVRSKDRIVTVNYKGRPVYRSVKGVTLSPFVMPSGHHQVCLYDKGEQLHFLVHTLVLLTFVGPRPGCNVTIHGCHKDGNPSNNRLDNLYWGTRSENENDKVAHGTSNRGTRNRSNKLSEDDVRAVRILIAKGCSSDEIGKVFGVTRGTINAIRRGDSWSWLF